MGNFVKCFDIEELESLDPQQVALLKEAIERELSNSPEIRSILRARVQSVYDRMAAKNNPPPAGQKTPDAGGSP